MPSTRTTQRRRSTSNRSGRGGSNRGDRAKRSSASSRGKRGGQSRSGGRSSFSQFSGEAQAAFTVDEEGLKELVLQALETELGGVQVYETAIRCTQNEDLKEEWEEYLEQTEHHVEVVQELCQKLGIDPDEEIPGREIVRLHGETHVKAMEMALAAGDPSKAEMVAAEMVVLAEVKDHSNWELIGILADEFGDDERGTALREAYDEVEDEEDEHLYHTMGWSRELWIQGLGLPAAFPPPEEEKDVKSMAAAARAKTERKRSLKRR